MPEIGTSGSISGDRKRGVGHRPQATAPVLDSTLGGKSNVSRLLICENGARCCAVRCPSAPVRTVEANNAGSRRDPAPTPSPSRAKVGSFSALRAPAARRSSVSLAHAMWSCRNSCAGWDGAGVGDEPEMGARIGKGRMSDRAAPAGSPIGRAAASSPRRN
jgi:hypothetical protein